jgi:hypothetical protein
MKKINFLGNFQTAVYRIILLKTACMDIFCSSNRRKSTGSQIFYDDICLPSTGTRTSYLFYAKYCTCNRGD